MILNEYFLVSFAVSYTKINIPKRQLLSILVVENGHTQNSNYLAGPRAGRNPCISLEKSAFNILVSRNDA